MKVKLSNDSILYGTVSQDKYLILMKNASPGDQLKTKYPMFKIRPREGVKKCNCVMIKCVSKHHALLASCNKTSCHNVCNVKIKIFK